MIPMTVKELLEATGGRLMGGSQDVNKEFTGVKTDNRECTAGDLFIAIVGEKNDAHRFIPGALEKGAAGCLISREPESYEADRFYVLVKDTTLALGDLARCYRGKFHIPVIGVTGSVGKTTTKDMIAAVLSARFNVLKTAGNLNNNFGVPRMLLQLEKEHEIAVIEMGMNHLGEIDYLTKIARPDAAVITNVGDAHIGNLGSRENILKAKSEIFAGLSEKGIAVLNGDDGLLRTLEGKIPFPIRWAGQGEDCDYRAVDIDDSFPDKLVFTAKTPHGSFPLEVPQPGRHMLYSVMTAAALGQYFGMTNEEIAQGVSSYVPTAMRLDIRELEGNTVLYNGAYNANSDSMISALRTMCAARTARKAAVLGDMLEQGDFEEELHRKVGRAAAECRLDTLVTVGRAAGAYLADEAKKAGLKDVRVCRDLEEAKEVLKDLVMEDTAILFKASHSMHLEKLFDFCLSLKK